MGNVTLQKLVSLIVKYLDKERLMQDNPGVTQEMIDGFFQTISHPAKMREAFDTPAQGHEKRQSRLGTAGELIIYSDGASRGNPGKAGIGVAIFDKEHRLIEELHQSIGETTNNVAEYRAMILAARKAVDYHAKEVTFKADSELLVRQLNGAYRVKSPNIVPLYDELMALLTRIPAWKILHVRREENTLADALANKGIESAHCDLKTML
jgi:ribonuclease HI